MARIIANCKSKNLAADNTDETDKSGSIFHLSKAMLPPVYPPQKNGRHRRNPVTTSINIGENR